MGDSGALAHRVPSRSSAPSECGTPDDDTGALTGVEAVIGKDLTAALLAEDLTADFLLILTDVPNVAPAPLTRRRSSIDGVTTAGRPFPGRLMPPRHQGSGPAQSKSGSVGSSMAVSRMPVIRSGVMRTP